MNKTFTYWEVDIDGKWLLENIDESYHEIPAHNKGDLIFRMALYALITGDVQVIKTLIKLLNAGNRWPDSMSNEGDCKNRLQYWWGRQKYFYFGAKTHKYGPRHNISRDCCIMLICAVYWHQYEMIQDIKIPWKIQRPHLYHWFEYLKTNDPTHKARFERWQSISMDISLAFKFPGYSKHLIAWMAWIAKSEPIKSKLKPHLPIWNRLCEMLCGAEITEPRIVTDYAPQTGYLWTADEWPDPPIYLEDNEPVYIDKQILQFVYENQDWK